MGLAHEKTSYLQEKANLFEIGSRIKNKKAGLAAGWRKAYSMKSSTRLFFLAILFLMNSTFGGEELQIRGTNFANWWVLGKPVTFRASQKPESPITGRVFDSSDRMVFSKTVQPEEFNRDGWSYLPETPGYYEVEFLMDNHPIKDAWALKVYMIDPKEKNKYILGAEKIFFAPRHPIVVAPAETKKVDEISPLFGASLDSVKESIPVSRLVGFRTIRFHALRWDQMEKEKGKIDWTSVDEFMTRARENGYRDEDVVFNIFGVPRWASSRPEADQIQVFLPEYTTVIPKDLADWDNFIRAVMARYPKVKVYELWNEPHKNRLSCFWSDSVENFVALLKSGYETVKSVNPEATVWLGGIALRYLPFYEDFLKLGGGNYFDVLPLHGSWQNPSPFHELEKKFGVPDKPVVNSEWHAMLLTPNQAPLPSEKLLARNMLLDFLNQVRGGITNVNIFGMINFTEKETLEYQRSLQWFHTHAAGLFRRQPYIQPRLPALAWHNLISWVKGSLKVEDGYLFDDQRQRALLLESENGPMLLVWNNSDTPCRISGSIFEAVGKQSSIWDMEGKKYENSPKLTLEPDNYYMIFSPELEPIARWSANKGEVLIPFEPRQELKHETHGTYRAGKLFDENFQLISPQTLRYFPITSLVSCSQVLPPGNISGRFAVGITPEAFELYVEVKDPSQIDCTDSSEVWNFDSIQFALDTTSQGYEKRRLEIAAARNRKGESVLWKSIAPNPDGDLPGHYTPAGQKIQYGRVEVVRENDTTFYKISLDASELYPFVYSPFKPIRFSLLINNNDGEGRASYLEWGGGIGGVKDVGLFGDLTVQADETAYPSQKQLIYKGWNQTDYELEIKDDSVRVIGTSPLCSGVTTKNFKLTPGAVYQVVFEARGNASILCMASGNGVKRLDLCGATKLTDQWKKFDLQFTAPETAETAAIFLYAWQQPGCEFEVRNFQVSPQ